MSPSGTSESGAGAGSKARPRGATFAQALLKACRLPGPEVPVTAAGPVSAGVSAVLGVAGREGSPEAPSLPQSWALSPGCLRTLLTPQGRSFSNELCAVRIKLSSKGPWDPRTPSLESRALRP